MFSTNPWTCQSLNIRLRQNQPKLRSDLHLRLKNPWYWRLYQWNKERAQPFWCAKSKFDRNLKHYFHSTHTDFQRTRPTEIHRNPGRTRKTEVYEYHEIPMGCKTCLRYGHTVKRCRETIATCARCSNQRHNEDKCTSTEVRCCHYGADYQAFSRSCPIFKRETEIIQIRTK